MNFVLQIILFYISVLVHETVILLLVHENILRSLQLVYHNSRYFYRHDIIMLTAYRYRGTNDSLGGFLAVGIGHSPVSDIL